MKGGWSVRFENCMTTKKENYESVITVLNITETSLSTLAQ